MNDTVRDLRGGDWAWFSKAVLEMKLGWKANLVYMGLVAYANSKDQTCFPSKGTLAELLGVSKTTVYEGIQALKEASLVEISERKNGDTVLSNEYTLLPIPHAQYDPPMRNTNGGGVRNTNPPVRNTNGNKNNQQELEENKTPIAPAPAKEDLSVDNRVLCEMVGIFEIRQQETMHRRYKAFIKNSGLSAEAARKRMVEQWGLYQKEMSKLEWAFSGAAKFFESAIWNQTPDKWPYPKGSHKDPFENMKFIHSGGKK